MNGLQKVNTLIFYRSISATVRSVKGKRFKPTRQALVIVSSIVCF